MKGMAATARPIVLVVDDDSSVREFLKDALESAGFKVLVAESGERALAAAGAWQDRIDVLVCDIVLPRMSGYVLADSLQEIHPETKVLHISGHPDISAAVRSGFPERHRRFLLKPFYPRDLLWAVGALMHDHETRPARQEGG